MADLKSLLENNNSAFVEDLIDAIEKNNATIRLQTNLIPEEKMARMEEKIEKKHKQLKKWVRDFKDLLLRHLIDAIEAE